MDIKGWEIVLIEWVNCLQLSEAVNDLNQLKDGVFFSSLLKIITENRNFNDVDMLTTIFEILKNEYPHCKFQDEDSVHIQDLTKSDIITISSLLMHYSCMLEHRDILTSPLCRKLSHHTQLSIRMFLEKVNTDVTKDIMFEIIRECSAKENNIRKVNISEYMSGGDSPLSCRSPLQELLSTPVHRKPLIQERDRELSKLKQELEIERYEKLDIQEELKRQQEFNEKIGKELAEKIGEIKKLRSELLVSQYASPFKNDDQFSQELQRRLKGEVKSLEQYVSQLQLEIESIQKERDILNQKLTKIEEQYGDVQNKCLNTEQRYDGLLEKFTSQKSELENLRQHCAELTTLLDELKISKANDSCVEVESSAIGHNNQKRKSLQMSSCEDLAHAVVEVQLRDSIKENNDLKVLLKSVQETNNSLQENIKIGNQKFEDLNNNYQNLQQECKELTSKVSLLYETQSALEETKDQLVQITQAVQELTIKNISLNKKIDGLENQLSVTKNILSESENTKDELNDNIRILEQKVNTLQDSLNEKHVICEALEQQNKQLQLDLKESVEKFNTTELELRKFVDKFKNLDDSMEDCLKTLEFLIFGDKKEDFCYEDKKLVFEKILKQIEFKQIEEINEKLTLHGTIAQLEQLVANLQEDVAQLNEKNSVTIQEKYLLSESLRFADNKVDELNTVIQRYENKVENLNATIAEMVTTIEQLERLKAIIEEKEAVIKNKNCKIDLIETELLSLKEELVQHKGLLVEVRDSKENLILKMSELNGELLEVQNSFKECNRSKNELEKKLELLEAEKAHLNAQLSSANKEICISKKNENSLNDELENVKELVKELQDKITQSKFEVTQHEIVEIELKRTIYEIQNDNEHLRQEIAIKSEIERKIQNTVSECHKREEELKVILEKAVQEIEIGKITEETLHKDIVAKEKRHLEAVTKLQEQILTHKNEILYLEEQLKDSVEVSNRLSSELKNTEIFRAQLNEELEKAKHEFDRKINLLNVTLTKLDENVKTFSFKRDELQGMLTKRNQICENLEKENGELLLKQNVMKEEINSLVTSLQQKQKECADLHTVSLKLKQEMENEKLELKNKSILVKEMEEKVKSQEFAISHLNQLIQSENSRVEKYEAKMNELKKEIEIITELKTATEEKYTDLENNNLITLKEYQNTVEELKNKLTEQTQKQEVASAKIENLRTELEEKCKQHETAVAERCETITQHNKEIENLNKQISKLKNENLKLSNREFQYLDELRNLKDELHEIITKYSETLENIQELKMENEMQVNALTENLHSVISKYNSLDQKLQTKIKEEEVLRENYECLKNNHEELLNKFHEQDSFHKEELEREVILFNSKIKELNAKEHEFQDQLTQVVSELEKMTMSNKDLLDNNNSLLSELERSQTQSKDLIENLKNIKELHEKLETDYNSLKEAHECYIKENEKTVEDAQQRHKSEIEELMQEKKHFGAIISESKNKIDVLIQEKEQISKNYENKLEEKNESIERFHFENEALKQNIVKITEELRTLEEKIQEEKEKYRILKITTDENMVQEKEKIKKFEHDITKLKCANDILETGQHQLQNEIKKLTDKITSLEDLKLNDEQQYKKDILLKDEEILENTKIIEELEMKLLHKNETIKELQHNYYVASKELKDEKVELETLLENEKMLFSSYKTELESKITSLMKEQIQVYEVLTEQYNFLKQSYEEKYQTNEKLRVLVEKFFVDCNSSKILQDEETDTKQIEQLLHIKENIEDNLNNLESLNNKKLENVAYIRRMCSKLQELNRSKNNLLESQSSDLKDTEINLLRVHENAVKVASELCAVISSDESVGRDPEQALQKLEKLLDGEKKSKEILELKVMNLTTEKFKISQLQDILKDSIENMIACIGENFIQNYTLPSGFVVDVNSFETISYCIKEVEQRIISIIDEKRKLVKKQKELEIEKENSSIKLDSIFKQNQSLNKEKEKLLNDYDCLLNEHNKVKQELQKIDSLSVNLNQLKGDYEKQLEVKETLILQNSRLEENLKEFEMKETQFKELHNRLIISCKDIRSRLDTLIKERNALEVISTSLFNCYNSVQNKVCLITESKVLQEQKHTLEVLTADTSKQLEKLSKTLYKTTINAILNLENQLTQKTSLSISEEPNILQLDFEEKIEEVNDLKERANDIMQQMKAFEKSVENYVATKSSKLQKENIPLQNSNAMKEDEYKKKNLALKQKLTLAENSKANLEKKIKQLREENKKLTEKIQPENEVLYKQLLDEHCKTKEEYERILQDCNKQYEALLHEYENYKAQKHTVPDQIIKIKTEKDVETESQLQSYQEAFSKILNQKCKLEIENEALQSLLKEKHSHANGVDSLKENYTKILEENTKLKTELDTVKYKRTRDREEYAQLLNKEKEKETQKLQEIRSKYDAKLDLLKKRMISLYNDELEKETQKKLDERYENEQLSHIVKNLQSELEKANRKIIELEKTQRFERESYLHQSENDVRNSRESLHSVCSRDGFRESVARLKTNISEYKRGLQFQNENAARIKAPLDDVFDVPDSNLIVRKKVTEEKVYSTLPRNFDMNVIQEVTLSKASLTSLHQPIGQSLEMEDEESDLFNNKYLEDLKEGRCTLPAGKESNVNRLSELQWRNSLYPPHLKSSYPAETQFNSPSQFKEEEIKAGAVEFDESMSTKLLPGDKTRKKDIGTTSYKKPGPPTPSKNGGRVSLQGNEIHPIREHNDKTPKRVTPSRLRALFMGRSSISARENSENQPGTPKSRRLSIFRRPR